MKRTSKRLNIYFFPLFISIIAGLAIVAIILSFADEDHLSTLIPAVIVGIIIIYYIYLKLTKKRRKVDQALSKRFPKNWKFFMLQYVAFYNGLGSKEKKKFEKDVQTFLAEKEITPIDCSINEYDRLLVASSAIIPIFGFGNFDYPMLDEILIYPQQFNNDYQTDGVDRNILGMVGNGVMNRKMILSLPALRASFMYKGTSSNVGIHEFSHLIDGYDGATDGIPRLLLEKQYIVPWLDIMHKEIQKIQEGKSDINPYGATNQQEFFAVASEYFFSRPDMMEDEHKELYDMMVQIFKQKPNLYINQS
ncbi:MAG: zinc-dependent peptidase [Hyphomicrobiales bacterium]